MVRFLVRIEAVNLGASIFDTDDLSVIRGGGFANLLLPRVILMALDMGKMDVVFAGASQAVGILETPPEVTQQAIEQRLGDLASGKVRIAGEEKAVVDALPHLNILCATVPADAGFLKASRQAAGHIRIVQMMNLTVDRGGKPSIHVRRPCEVDGQRGADEEISKGGDKLRVSSSVAIRRNLGQSLRKRIYERLGVRDRGSLDFADSFSDLVDNPPPGLPPSLKGKMAVVHIDGNKFTMARENAISSDGTGGQSAAKQFSETVHTARASLLEKLLSIFAEDGRMFHNGKLRFETLMWGGDEARFVLPAWKVRDLLNILADDIDSGFWDFDGGRLTNAVGILVCHHKTPIARASSLVEDVVGSAKEHAGSLAGAPHDVLAIQLIESIEPPTGGLEAFRQRLYHSNEAGAFAVAKRAGVRGFIESYSRITDPKTGLPRSQIYNLIAEARRSGLAGAEPPKDIDLDKLIEKAVRRSRAAEGDAFLKALKADLLNPAFGVSTTAPFIGLVRIAEMWDLMRPFAEVEYREAELV